MYIYYKTYLYRLDKYVCTNYDTVMFSFIGLVELP